MSIAITYNSEKEIYTVNEKTVYKDLNENWVASPEPLTHEESQAFFSQINCTPIKVKPKLQFNMEVKEGFSIAVSNFIYEVKRANHILGRKEPFKSLERANAKEANEILRNAINLIENENS